MQIRSRSKFWGVGLAGAALLITAGTAAAAIAVGDGPGGGSRGPVAATGGSPRVASIPSSGSTGSRRAATAGAPQTSKNAARTVAYRGHTIAVPAGWQVIDLSKSPTTCVRFDVHAVYLGTPSSEQHCGGAGSGRVQGAVLVEPAAGKTASTSTVDDSVAQRITATLPGITMTASYAVGTGGDRSTVVSVLGSAGAAAPTTPPAVAPQAAVSARVSANLATAATTGTGTAAVVAAQTQRYVGVGFDACTAPDTSQMSAWLSSPFRAVGVYIGGAGRACAQPNLNAAWVSTENAAGWHLLPLYVGPQVTSGTITDATAQGTAAAQDAVTQASSLGIGTGALLYYDMENSNYTAAQISTAQAFLGAWTTELHSLGYRSGVYGAKTGAEGALVSGWGTMAEPDAIDVANWNTQKDDDPGADTAGHWVSHRVHQFLGPADATYGGVTINIDEDYFSLIGCGAALGAVDQPGYQPNCTMTAQPAG